MAYGAVTRNLVKRVGELEARLDDLNGMVGQWKEEVTALVRAHARFQRGELSRDDYLFEIDEIATALLNTSMDLRKEMNS